MEVIDNMVAVVHVKAVDISQQCEISDGPRGLGKDFTTNLCKLSLDLISIVLILIVHSFYSKLKR